MSETAPEPQTTPAPEQAPPAETVTPPPAQPAAQPEPQQHNDPQDGQRENGADELPSWAQRELKKLRDEAAGNRVKAKETADALTKFRSEQEQREQEQRQRLAKALGLVNDDEPPSVDELTKQLEASNSTATEAQNAARATRVELAVFRAAAAANVDANALLDSRSFVSQIVGLDDTAEDFSGKVNALIEKAAEQNSRYKLKREDPTQPAPPVEPPAPPAVPRSGAEGFTSAPNGPRQWTEQDVERASPKQVEEALEKGLLQSLGFGARRGSRR
jgi:hypothetical protein